MSKFKVGDRVIGNAKANEHYRVTTEGFKATVTSIIGASIKINNGFIVDADCFDLIESPHSRCELHVTSDGTTTNAVYKLNGKVEKTAKAVCCPSDTYNFNVGAELAINRVLYGTDYNPKDVAVKAESAPKQDEPKFKVGDKVKSISGWYEGEIGTITKIDDKRREVLYQIKFPSTLWWKESSAFEPYTELEKPKREAVTLYCVKDYINVFEIHALHKGKFYEFDGQSVNYDEMKCAKFSSFENWKSCDPSYADCLIRAEKRPAKVGEWVLMVAETVHHNPPLAIGEVCKVIEDGNGVISRYIVIDKGNRFYDAAHLDEYLVLPDYVPEKVEPEYWNGKVVCVAWSGNLYTVGKVYEVVNGCMKNNNGGKSVLLHSFDEVGNYCHGKFIEYRGEQS